MSVTITGVLVALVGYLFTWLGIPVIPEQLEPIISGVVGVVGLIVAYYGRVKKGDVNALGLKR